MNIIAICGSKRSGKDTISNILSDFGYVNYKISADLKHACKAMFDFTDEQLECDVKDVIDDRWNITPRQAMQYIGTDIAQFHIQQLIPDIGRDFWIRKTIQKMKESKHTKIVISDLRFLHEYKALKDAFGDRIHIWRVERPSSNLKECTHISEIEWKDIPYDRLFMNDSTLDSLFTSVVRQYKQIN